MKYKLAIVFLALCCTNPALAQNPICETGENVDKDFCYTYLGGNFQLITGAEFGELSFAVRNLYESRESFYANSPCFLSFDGEKLTGRYTLVSWATSFDDAVACVFRSGEAIKIMKSLRKNSRYQFEVPGADIKSFYRNEEYLALELGSYTEAEFIAEIDKASIAHAEISASRTAYDPTEIINNIIDKSLIDRFMSIIE